MRAVCYHKEATEPIKKAGEGFFLKGIINQSQRGAYRRWKDRKPENSLRDSLELM